MRGAPRSAGRRRTLAAAARPLSSPVTVLATMRRFGCDLAAKLGYPRARRLSGVGLFFHGARDGRRDAGDGTRLTTDRTGKRTFVGSGQSSTGKLSAAAAERAATGQSAATARGRAAESAKSAVLPGRGHRCRSPLLRLGLARAGADRREGGKPMGPAQWLRAGPGS